MEEEAKTQEKGQAFYRILCVVLALGIIAVFCTMVLPKLLAPQREYGSLEDIDFSSSQWLDEYMEKTVGLYGLYFTENSAFSAGQGKGMLSVTYASELSVEELREEYKAGLSAAEYGRNDETALHLCASLPAGELDIVNYYSPLLRIIDTELSVGEQTIADISAQLDAVFPETELTAIEQLATVRSAQEYGRYVRYIYDDLDAYFYKGKPIFSEARLFAGDEQDFAELTSALSAEYTDNSSDEATSSYYYKTGSGILGLALASNSAGDRLAAISFQYSE